LGFTQLHTTSNNQLFVFESCNLGWKLHKGQQPILGWNLGLTKLLTIWSLVGSVFSGSLSSLWPTSFRLPGLWSLPFVSFSLPFFGCFLFVKFGRVSSSSIKASTKFEDVRWVVGRWVESPPVVKEIEVEGGDIFYWFKRKK